MTLDTLLAEHPPEPEKCRRHKWAVTVHWDDRLGNVADGTQHCLVCQVLRDPVRSRRGKTARNYGNRAELKVARTYGGTKVGHHGGPVDVRGRDFATQVRTKRRRPPTEWKAALGAMSGGTRCPRMLIRFVQPGGPEDYFVFRAEDFLAWFGRDDEEETQP